MRVVNTNFIDKQISPLCRCLLLMTFLLFFSGHTVFAQAPGMLEFGGRTVKDNKPISGATVTVYRNGNINQEELKTGKNGKFRFYLVFGSDYKITFSYPGCVDMFLMVYTSKLPKERSDLFPLYETEIPFFESNNAQVRISKYKNPFTKVIYDGKKAFMDDEAYLAAFTKDLLIDPSEQAKLFAEKEAAEKAEKDKLEATEKAKRDAEDKAKRDAEDKLLAEQKAKEDALAREMELARLKLEADKKQNVDKSMETEAMRLQREKEEKEQLAKKNKEIKTKYENDLLKLVAENERIAKEKAFSKQKLEVRSNTVIEQMKRETELKAKADGLREEAELKKKKELENKQYKLNEMRKLVEAAAFADRSVKISNQKVTPDATHYVRRILPNVAVTVDDGYIKTVRTTVVTQGKQQDTYRKETYFWGSVYCYKNNIEIDEITYNAEVGYYSSYENR
ncbi:MAG: hypothetical protein JWP12_2265 [Bacteroidetes bacterium]|nr:hypothetical protein [Bacteroidota bacterium]